MTDKTIARSGFACQLVVALILAWAVCLLLPSAVSAQSGIHDGLPANGFEIPAASAMIGQVDTVVPPNESGGLSNAADPQSSPGQNLANATLDGSRRLLGVVLGGGPLMIPIGICSFILVVFVFERLIGLRKGRIIPGHFSARFIEQLREGDLDPNTAIAVCDRNGSPIAEVFKAGVEKWGRPSVEVEQAILDAGERASNKLRKYLRLINGIATVCPLLGLLGTVLGMIQAFDSIATVSNTVADPKALIATGISQALLTTAAGMSVAIPALISYLFFSSRVDRHVMEIDALGMKVVNLVSAEAVSQARSGKKAA